MYPKELIRGTLTTLILRVLEENGKMYGYQIAQNVKALSEEMIAIKEGSLYPILHKLEAKGHVTVEKVAIGRRVRKYYTLTADGKQEATAKTEQLRAFIQTLKRFLDPMPGLELSV